jgi:hypothetical protein
MTSGAAPHQGSRHGIVDAADTQRIQLDHVQHHWGNTIRHGSGTNRKYGRSALMQIWMPPQLVIIFAQDLQELSLLSDGFTDAGLQNLPQHLQTLSLGGYLPLRLR